MTLKKTDTLWQWHSHTLLKIMGNKNANSVIGSLKVRSMSWLIFQPFSGWNKISIHVVIFTPFCRRKVYVHVVLKTRRPIQSYWQCACGERPSLLSSLCFVAAFSDFLNWEWNSEFLKSGEEFSHGEKMEGKK